MAPTTRVPSRSRCRDLAAQSREGGFLDLWTVAAVVPGRPTAALTPPSCGVGVDLGWQQEATPPSQTRHVALPLAGLGPAAQVALARETPALVGLNPRLPDVLGAGPDRAIAIVPAVLAAAGSGPATATGQGEVHDRMAPAAAATYRVAQSDWFGRWSQWAPGIAGAGRPPDAAYPVARGQLRRPGNCGRRRQRRRSVRPAAAR